LRIRAILFDKDGTLTDFHATWMPAYREAAQALAVYSGRPALAEALLVAGGYDPASGRCRPSSPLAAGTIAELARVWAQAAQIEAAPVVEILGRTFAESAAARAVPVTDLEGLFASLRARGLRLGVATMDSEALAHKTLARFGLGRSVDFVCGYDSGHGEKPGPGMVRAFCARVGLEPRAVAVVGDTPHDLRMARSAATGLAVGVLTGASPREALAGLADHVLEHVGEIEGVLD